MIEYLDWKWKQWNWVMKLKSLCQECHKWVDPTNESLNWVYEWAIRCGRSSLVVALSDRSDRIVSIPERLYRPIFQRYQKLPFSHSRDKWHVKDTVRTYSQVCPTFGKQQHRSPFVSFVALMDSLQLTLGVYYPNDLRCRWYRGKNVMLLISSIFLARLIAAEKFGLKGNGYY